MTCCLSALFDQDICQSKGIIHNVQTTTAIFSEMFESPTSHDTVVSSSNSYSVSGELV